MDDQLRHLEEIRSATERAARRARGRALLLDGAWTTAAIVSLGIVQTWSLPWYWRWLVTVAVLLAVTWPIGWASRFGKVHARPSRRSLYTVWTVGTIGVVVIWFAVRPHGVVSAILSAVILFAAYAAVAWWVSRFDGPSRG